MFMSVPLYRMKSILPSNIYTYIYAQNELPKNSKPSHGSGRCISSLNDSSMSYLNGIKLAVNFDNGEAFWQC